MLDYIFGGGMSFNMSGVSQKAQEDFRSTHLMISCRCLAIIRILFLCLLVIDHVYVNISKEFPYDRI